MEAVADIPGRILLVSRDLQFLGLVLVKMVCPNILRHEERKDESNTEAHLSWGAGFSPEVQYLPTPLSMLGRPQMLYL